MAAARISDGELLRGYRAIAEITAENNVLLLGTHPMGLPQRSDRQYGDAAVGDRIHNVLAAGQQRFARQMFLQVELLPEGQIVGIVDAEDWGPAECPARRPGWCRRNRGGC